MSVHRITERWKPACRSGRDCDATGVQSELLKLVLQIA